MAMKRLWEIEMYYRNILLDCGRGSNREPTELPPERTLAVLLPDLAEARAPDEQT
jgi:hypothetical protein